MADTGVDGEKAVEELELSRMKDDEAIALITEVVSKNGDLLSMFKSGREKPLMGKVMDVLGKRYEGSRAKGHISSL